MPEQADLPPAAKQEDSEDDRKGKRRREERKGERERNEKSMLMERSGGGTRKIGRSTTARTSRRGDMIPILIDSVYLLV
jgi:hypothetical protein